MPVPVQRPAPVLEQIAVPSARHVGGALLLMPCMTLPEWHLLVPLGRWVKAVIRPTRKARRT